MNDTQIRKTDRELDTAERVAVALVGILREAECCGASLESCLGAVETARMLTRMKLVAHMESELQPGTEKS